MRSQNNCSGRCRVQTWCGGGKNVQVTFKLLLNTARITCPDGNLFDDTHLRLGRGAGRGGLTPLRPPLPQASEGFTQRLLERLASRYRRVTSAGMV